MNFDFVIIATFSNKSGVLTLLLPVMSVVMSPEAGRLFEGHAANDATKVLLLAVEKLVLLQRALAEESFGAEGADVAAALLLLLPAGVHALPVVGQQVLHEETLAAQVANEAPLVAVKLHVKLQVVFVVEELLADVAFQGGADFVFELEVIATSSCNAEGFWAQRTLERTCTVNKKNYVTT